MKKLIEWCLKSAWSPLFVFLFIYISGRFITELLIYPSKDLFYTDSHKFYMWKNVSIVFQKTTLLAAWLYVAATVGYKIKHKLWFPLIISILVFVVVFYGNAFIKRGLGGRIVSWEETDRTIRIDLKELSLKIEKFKTDHGVYPKTLNELGGYSSITMHPVRNGINMYPKDWPFYYQASEDQSDYDLRSQGVDMKLGTIDDIVWKSFNAKNP